MANAARSSAPAVGAPGKSYDFSAFRAAVLTPVPPVDAGGLLAELNEAWRHALNDHNRAKAVRQVAMIDLWDARRPGGNLDKVLFEEAQDATKDEDAALNRLMQSPAPHTAALHYKRRLRIARDTAPLWDAAIAADVARLAAWEVVRHG